MYLLKCRPQPSYILLGLSLLPSVLDETVSAFFRLSRADAAAVAAASEAFCWRLRLAVVISWVCEFGPVDEGFTVPIISLTI